MTEYISNHTRVLHPTSPHSIIPASAYIVYNKRNINQIPSRKDSKKIGEYVISKVYIGYQRRRERIEDTEGGKKLGSPTKSPVESQPERHDP